MGGSLSAFLLVLVLINIKTFVCGTFLPSTTRRGRVAAVGRRVTRVRAALSRLHLTTRRVRRHVKDGKRRVSAGRAAASAGSAGAASTTSSIAGAGSISYGVDIARKNGAVSGSNKEISFDRPVHVAVRRQPRNCTVRADGVCGRVRIGRGVLGGRRIGVDHDSRDGRIIV